ncbi:MAG TPA: hypothetical protein DCR93_27510, partial [Cytophagales bacterium]|nr:hypothetical protein [Cytophagales bacterium]
HLPHEAWHVVQQKQDRVKPTLQMKGRVSINDDAGLEREADIMGARAMTVGTGSASVASTVPSRSVNANNEVVQGKWFRMSTIWDETDEREVNQIREMVEEKNQYISGFTRILRTIEIRPDELSLDFSKALHRADQAGQLAILVKFLENTYWDTYSHTAGQVVEGLEKAFPEEDSDSPVAAISEYQAAQLDEDFSTETFTAQELGLMALEEIKRIASQVDSQEEIALHFARLQAKYGMSKIGFQSEFGRPVRVRFKINPEFEIELTGGHAVEMRSEGSGAGTVQSRVRWVPSTLNLTTTGHPGGGTYTVGDYMKAYPLSQDHATGTKSTADSDHDGMMGKLPSKTYRSLTGSGSGPYFYIKGHLLNDNLGGIANEANLFPITHDANGQHKNYVEQYIKNGIKQGYVYRYEVQIQNVNVGYDSTLSRYTVDSDLAFDFARLDTSLKDVTGTHHSGVIESRYQSVGTEPFDKTAEYATDYNGSYNNPKAVGGEATSTSTEKKVASSNTGLFSFVPSFSIASTLGISAFGGTPQSIDPGATAVPKGQKLSIRKSTKANVGDHFEDVVTGWNRTDIDNWIDSVVANSYTRWTDVWSEATSNHSLDAGIPPLIKSNGLLTRVSINGAAVGT